MSTPTLSLVIPVFNEQECIASNLATIERALTNLSMPLEIVLVDDGSTDTTCQIITDYLPQFAQIKVVQLSRNFGKEAALSAGLMHARGDAVVPLDADLQDPPELIEQMVAQWKAGHEVVIAQREDRQSDRFLKRITAKAFYRLINAVAEVPIPKDVGDFRLMDRAVVDVINSLPENRRFMKGLFAWAGFRTSVISYMRQPRSGGETKFSFWRLWNLALEGLTSFSTAPLRIWTYLGFLFSTAAFLYGAYIIIRTLMYGNPVPGYPSLLTIILFVSGLQLAGMGIIGEYLGRAYLESKRRPAYVVRRVVDCGK